MMVEVSVGEVVDKYTILDIKQDKILDEKKLIHIMREKSSLLLSLEDQGYLRLFEKEIKELKSINEKLWDIEDRIRVKELNKQFDEEFIELARSVYITNDQRFEVKSRINQLSNSNFKEMKSYENYK
jgi:hypothetical protein